MDHLLIIEDDEDVLDNLKDILEHYGYMVSTAKDGFEGYLKAIELLPDLIICDIKLPELDGYELLDKLKRNPDTFMIPFLFLTAFTDKMFRRKGMNLGADDFITKPFENKDILNAVNSKINKYTEIRKSISYKLEFLRETISNAIPQNFVSPLHSILGFTTVLNNNYHIFDDEERLSLINNIFECGEIMLKMLDNYGMYLNLSTKIFDQLDLAEEDYSSNNFISEILEKESNHYRIISSLRANIEPAKLMLQTNYLKKIISEFVSIASRYSYPEKQIQFEGITTNNDNYSFSVTFYSKGLSKPVVESIGNFDNHKIKDINDQYCLVSMSLVKLIAELHKGSFSVSSIPYDKTKLEVVIPKF